MLIGAHNPGNGRCRFVVWAPFCSSVEVKILSSEERVVPMVKNERGYWGAVVDDVFPGTFYFYRLDSERDRPDPASHFQPAGVHGPSQVVEHNSFEWDDREWKGVDISRMIIYELHTGVFTEEGTFEAVIPRLDELKDLGVNAVELMPVAQFPGDRNWGYDGACPFAVQNSYGGPSGLKVLVNECHKRGMAVILDVVYNHLGPEGNYLWDFGPYFTDKYNTPWGKAINFDGPDSDEVKNYFIKNALHWFGNYHIDALRLDAVHAICDMGAEPFLKALAASVDAFSKKIGRKFYLIAESDLNDSRIIRPPELGGFGIDAQWCDDFHHSLHTLLTGENSGYYSDFGKIEHMVKSLREGYTYSGQYSVYRKKSQGNPSKDRPARQFVVFSQNHDQTGNRMLGERLSTLVSFEALKLAAGVVILSPYMPLIFMGEEYGEYAPFLYFVSHTDEELVEAVRNGRREEFKAFSWKGEPPDPQSEETFLRTKLNWSKRQEGNHKIILDFYRNLIKLRKEVPALSSPDKDSLEAYGREDKKVIIVRRWEAEHKSHVLCIFNFNKETREIQYPVHEGEWEKILSSADVKWQGPGDSLPDCLSPGDKLILNAESFALYMRKEK